MNTPPPPTAIVSPAMPGDDSAKWAIAIGLHEHIAKSAKTLRNDLVELGRHLWPLHQRTPHGQWLGKLDNAGIHYKRAARAIRLFRKAEDPAYVPPSRKSKLDTMSNLTNESPQSGKLDKVSNLGSGELGLERVPPVPVGPLPTDEIHQGVPVFIVGGRRAYRTDDESPWMYLDGFDDDDDLEGDDGDDQLDDQANDGADDEDFHTDRWASVNGDSSPLDTGARDRAGVTEPTLAPERTGTRPIVGEQLSFAGVYELANKVRAAMDRVEALMGNKDIRARYEAATREYLAACEALVSKGGA